jgi:hypothetical protein
MTAHVECFIEDGDRRSLQFLIIQGNDIADRRIAIAGRERNHFGHGYPQQLNAVPVPDGDLLGPPGQYRHVDMSERPCRFGDKTYVEGEGYVLLETLWPAPALDNFSPV